MALGLAHWRSQRYEKALHFLDQILITNQNNADYLVLRGMVLRQLPGLLEQALSTFCSAVLLDPQRADTYYNLANLLSDNDKELQAERAFRISLRFNPKAALALHNLGICLNGQQRFEEALISLSQSVKEDPLSADAWCNLGLAYFGLDRFTDAKDSFAKAISLDQSHGASHVNMGNALVSTLEPELALSYLQKGVELESSSANSLWNLSLAYLLTGDFTRGWDFYEARFSTKNFSDYERPTVGSQPQSLADCTHDPNRPLVVWTEQGIGDAVQFCRYLLMLQTASIPFVFMTRSSLMRLFSEWFEIPDHLIVDQPMSTNPTDDRQQIPLLSLPRLFRTDILTIPSVTPYFKASSKTPPALLISPPPGGLSIGLVWASNPTNKAMYRNKSCPLELLMPRFLQLLDLDLIDLHCLQFGSDSCQLDPWRLSNRIIDWSESISDFSDTAHVLSQLDLVISVDTAVAHISAALGRNTWVLLPHNADFRWLRDRDDSPWYSSMRLFRQPDHRDWQGLVDLVNQALDELFMFDINSLSKEVLV
ncbi:tetratricopeptide repeat protein [Synechococcus sp. PROS-U-1]|uniref:tetratricopeptide repeat protein n=1 Tax=Synechococcus sp. PROS-U-1 TaxID=1400866 RepID=UPI001CA4040F|nr:tetratricopeptide repeat protein [Synechococcus sp. PROS-U-1]